MIKKAILVTVLVFLQACASVGPGKDYTVGDAEALVLFETEYGFIHLEEVDLDAGKVIGKKDYSLAGTNWIDSPRLMNSEKDRLIAVAKIPPGDYAIFSASNSGWNGVSTVTTSFCFEDMAKVVRLASGTVNVLPYLKRSDTDLLPGVETILEAHPTITAPRLMAEELGIITYVPNEEEKPGILSRRGCADTKTIKVLMRP